MIQKFFTLGGSHESNILGPLKSKLNMPLPNYEQDLPPTETINIYRQRDFLNQMHLLQINHEVKSPIYVTSQKLDPISCCNTFTYKALIPHIKDEDHTCAITFAN